MRYFLLLLTLPLLAQDVARIEGRIIDSEGKPIAGATVQSGLTSDRAPRSVQTGPEGTFVFEDLAPAPNYALTAQKAGYMRTVFGSGSGDGRTMPPPPFAVAAGETMRVELRMIQQGVITGTITNQSGDPVAQATVVLWQEKYRVGVKERVYVRIGQTDDRGVYRFPELPAGRYVVISGETAAGSARQSETNLTTYLGGTQDTRRASAVEVTPGGEAHADITLLRGKVYTLRGTMLDGNGPLARRLVAVRRNGDAAFTTRAKGVTDAEGKFEINDLSPGEYAVDVGDSYDPQTGARLPRLVSQARVAVGTADVDDFVFRVSSGAAISGTVQVEGAEWSPPSAQQSLIGALSESLLSQSNNVTPHVALTTLNSAIDGSYPVQVRPDATFQIEGVIPGMYRFVVVGFPETFYLKSVKMGDLDVTRAAIPVPGDPLTVIVSAKGAEVSGTAARDGLSVVLWPENDNPWHPTHGIRIVNSSKGGSFALRGLAPGKYRAAVFETPETGVLYNYEFLSKFANEAAKVEVLEGAKVKAEPPLIPAARFKAEFEKLP